MSEINWTVLCETEICTLMMQKMPFAEKALLQMYCTKRLNNENPGKLLIFIAPWMPTGTLLADDIVGVQPMTIPSESKFKVKYKYE